MEIFMILKKLIIGIFFLIFLNGCAQNAALIGPAYTLASTGNVYQAGLAYSSNEAVTKLTGKSTAENIKEILKPDDKDKALKKLVKKQIEETRKKLNLIN
jgi:hypothetical protein|tara:strand:+ start:308 stop:607 length:300 start_codon:yes stop_codon:yes gene_type:complete